MSDFKTCSKCGTKNPAGNNFCEQCGVKLPASGSGKDKKPIARKAAPAAVSPPSISLEEEKKTFDQRTRFSFWLLLSVVLLAVFTRFDHLGAKPHHHDESMHAYYSYQLFTEGDYRYNPMMHGPFQFHGNALMYFLFGVSDATSRYLAAFFGVAIVLLALLTRPFLGKTAAWLTLLFLAASPSFMYFSRFTREDIYIAGGTFVWVIFLWRFSLWRKPVDFWLAAIGFAVAFCTKESIFLTIAVFGTYLFIRLLPRLDVLIAGLLTGIGLLSALIIPKSSPSRYPVFFLFIGVAFLYTIVKLFLRWRENRKNGPESDLWDLVCSLEFEKVRWELAAIALWWIGTIVFLRAPFLKASPSSLLSVLFVFAYLALLYRFGWLWLKGRAAALTGAVTLFVVIFTLLYTTFFTVGFEQAGFTAKLHGLWTALYDGAFGGLEYWWDQHDVRRGDQPWYYYLIQLPANEPLSFFFGLGAIAYYVFYPLWIRFRGSLDASFKKTDFYREKSTFQIFPLFLIYWYAGSLALFSWAGEKMPWLILHPLLPTLLLAATWLGDIWEKNLLTPFKRCLRATMIAAAAIFFSYSLHSAVLLCFYHEANPVEPLVYVQSGPDVREVLDWVEKISYGETGGPDIHLTIEDKCSWPFAWYLREYRHRGHPTTISQANDPIIFTATETDNVHYELLSKAGYVNRKYKLRVWWVPSWFKKGYPSRPLSFFLLWDWFWGNFFPIGTPRPDMVDRGDLKNWILYRKVWSDLGSYNMRLWVRKDLAERYGFTETSRSDIPVQYPKIVPETSNPGKS